MPGVIIEKTTVLSERFTKLIAHCKTRSHLFFANLEARQRRIGGQEFVT